MAQYDDLHTGTITVVGIISAVLTFVIIVAAQVLFYQYRTLESLRKEVDVPITQSDNILDQQREALNSYRWIDQEKGIVAIPIDQAKETVLQSLKKADAPAAN